MDESRERHPDHENLALQVGTALVSLRVGQSLVLGSAEGCDIRLSHRGVEPRHALLRVQEGRVLLDDLDSRSGTYVAGQRVEQFDLKPGDIAVLGQIPVQLVAGGRGVRLRR